MIALGDVPLLIDGARVVVPVYARRARRLLARRAKPASTRVLRAPAGLRTRHLRRAR